MNTNLNTRNNAHSVFIDEGKLLDDEGKKIGNYAKHIYKILGKSPLIKMGSEYKLSNCKTNTKAFSSKKA